MSSNDDPRSRTLDYVYGVIDAQQALGEGWADTRPYNWQSIRALSYVYTLAGSPFHGSDAIADAIRGVYGAICDREEPPDNRLTGHLADTRRLLIGGGAGDLVPGIDDQLVRGATPLADHLTSYRHMIHFCSANEGTSTNHVAVYGASVYRVGQILGRQDWMDQASEFWTRLAADQMSDGYWEETTGGPTTSYNHLTFCCAGRMARWTGHKALHAAAQLGAKFHRRFSYPDGSDLESIDGRVRYGETPKMWGGFVDSETPEGRAFVKRKLETLFERNPPESQGTHGGERIALMCENHELWVDGPLGDLEVDRRSYVDHLDVPGAIRREGAWFVSLQGITHLPRGWGGFTIDRTSIMSLWHEKTGLIVNGSGEPGQNPAQSFRFQPTGRELGYPTPERIFLEMGEAGSDSPASAVADYRGGRARVEVRLASDNEARISVSAYARADFYPIPFTLQLELRDGDRVNGSVLGDEAVQLGNEMAGGIKTDRFTITFPTEGAAFYWPHDPYNPYDVEKHKSARSAYVSLLTLPVGPEGIDVGIQITS